MSSGWHRDLISDVESRGGLAPTLRAPQGFGAVYL